MEGPPMMEPEKRARAPEDVAPKGRDFAGFVAIQDAAPILARWLKGAVVILLALLFTQILVVWGLWSLVGLMRDAVHILEVK